MAERLGRALARIRAAMARLQRARAEETQAATELVRARETLSLVNAGRPAPEFDAFEGANPTLQDRHLIGIDVRFDSGWARVALDSTMAVGTWGIEQLLHQYRQLAAKIRDARSSHAPAAIRLVVHGYTCEGFAVVPVEPWDWAAPANQSIDLGSLCTRLSS